MDSKLITEEELARQKQLPMGKVHPVRALIEQLQPGQILSVSRNDFRWRNRTPRQFTNPLQKAGKGKFIVTKQVGDTGWFVRRTE